MQDFDKLDWAARACHDSFPFLFLVQHYGDKRQHVAMYLHDFPALLSSYKSSTPDSDGSTIVEVDPFPGLRLAAACEGLANAVYGACEIAASFANKASSAACVGKPLPSSFNQLRKQIRSGELPSALLHPWRRELQWYERVRELRTEWTHFSTVFVGENAHDAVIRVDPLRRKSDRTHFPQLELFTVSELSDWSERATVDTDGFMLAVYMHYVLPRVQLAQEIFCPQFDDAGFPRFEGGSLRGKRMSLADYLKLGGIDFAAAEGLR